jgi:hypothetical protein
VTPADALTMLRAGDSWVVTYGDFKAAREMPWMHLAHAQIPFELIEPPPSPPEIKPDAVVVPAALLDKIDGLIKPVPVEEFKPIAKPTAAPKQAAATNCANGSCYAPTRRFFRRW